MDNIHKLAEYFREFPGIGPRQARRFVYFLLTHDSTYIKNFLETIKEVRSSVRSCEDCKRFFTDIKSINNTEEIEDAMGTRKKLCDICSDKNRETSSLLVVAKDADLDAIEKSHSYNGKYFVIGGNIQILDKNPEKRPRINDLIKIIKRGLEKGIENKENGLKEIILSFSANSEGEHTAEYIKEFIGQNFANMEFKISVLGRGLASGTEIEYSDEDTISSAIKNRF